MGKSWSKVKIHTLLLTSPALLPIEPCIIAKDKDAEVVGERQANRLPISFMSLLQKQL